MVFKNGKDTKVNMMKMTNLECYYYENETCQYLYLPYSTYPYKMVIALPKNNIENINLEEALQNFEEYKVTKLMLPKFKIEQEEDLREDCEKLGLGKMFDGSNDFDHMFKNSITTKSISKIKQKTFIK